jgi:hypothetical protein
MSRRKKYYENLQKSEKIKILKLLIEVPEEPSTEFLLKEIGMLNTFIERYNEEFAKVPNRPKKESMAIWLSEAMKPEVEKRWRAFNYVTDESKYPTYTLGEKVGEPYVPTKKKKLTIMQWIDQKD